MENFTLCVEDLTDWYTAGVDEVEPVYEAAVREDKAKNSAVEFMTVETKWLCVGAVLGAFLVLLLAPSPSVLAGGNQATSTAVLPAFPGTYTAELHPPLWTLGLFLSLSLSLSLSFSALSLSS